MRDVDVAIIGAGSAGLSAQREVARKTDSYVVIDEGPLGTTCARVGCMPSKALIQAANDFHRRTVFEGEGIRGSDGLTVDGAAVMRHVRDLRDYFVGSVLDRMERWRADHLVEGRARFVDPHTLDVDGTTIRARRIVLATGSRPVVPEAWKSHEQWLLDTDGIFELDALPRRMAVVGLGVIGLELGQALGRLGVEVVGLSMDKSLGGLTDPTVQDYAAETIAAEIETGFGKADIAGPEGDGIAVTLDDGRRWIVDRILLALGRRPAFDGLGLDAIGLLDEDGKMPDIDPCTLRANGSDIYVAGDATGARKLLHEAADEGAIAGYNAVAGDDHRFTRRMAMAVTFSDPEIAMIGETHRQLTDRGADFVTGAVLFDRQGRATIMQRARGMIHVYADRTSGTILGTEMIAPGAEHFAQFFSLAITMELTVQDILKQPFYHPVLEEGLRTAFRDAASKSAVPADGIELLRCAEPPVGGSMDAAVTSSSRA